MAGLPAPPASRRRYVLFPLRVRRVRRRSAGGIGGILSESCLQLPALRVQGRDLSLEGDDLRLQRQNERLGCGGQRVPGGEWQWQGGSLHAAGVLRRYPSCKTEAIPTGGA